MIVKNKANNGRAFPARSHKAICERVTANVMPKVARLIKEEQENELAEGIFGWGSPKKPEQELTADFVRSASSDELATVIAEYLNYWAASASDSVDKALSNSIQTVLGLCKAGGENAAESSKKVLKAIVDAVRMVLRTGGKLAIDGVKGVGRVIMLGVAMCFKLAANGIKAGETAAKYIYKTVADFLTSTYESLKDKVAKGAEAAKDGLTLFLKVSLAVVLLCANKVTGAVEAFGAWIKGVAKDVADKVTLAVIATRTWFAVTAKEVAEWVKATIGNVRSACVKAWNATEKAVIKLWKNISGKLLEWANDLRMTVAKIGEKIADTITAAGDHIIAAKDKTVVFGIGKAVKALSKNYSEDDIVGIVRAAYNEDLRVDLNGNVLLNEAYYTKTNLRRI